MGNVPRVEVIRSRTIFGLSVVQMIFEEGTESYWARQRVQEKLARTRRCPRAPSRSSARSRPPTARSSGTSCVADGTHRPDGAAHAQRLGRDPAAAARAGRRRRVELRRARQAVRGHARSRRSSSASACRSATSSTPSRPTTPAPAAACSRRGSMSFVIRGRARSRTMPRDRRRLRQVGRRDADLRRATSPRSASTATVPSGIFSKDRRDDAVEGIVLMRRGRIPSRRARRRSRTRSTSSTRSGCPTGVRVDAFYDRSYLVDSTLHTVAHSVLLGHHARGARAAALPGPPAMARAGRADDSVLAALRAGPDVRRAASRSACCRSARSTSASSSTARSSWPRTSPTVSARAPTRRRGAACTRRSCAAALEVERPVFFSMLMIIGAYLPLLTLHEHRGPAVPADGADGGLRADRRACSSRCSWCRCSRSFLFRRGYRGVGESAAALVAPALRRRRSVACWRARLAGRGASRGRCPGGRRCVVVPRLGIEFLPYMDEGVIWVRANFPEGTSLEQTAAFGKRIREIALEFPDVEFISVQAGRNDSGTDPFPPSRMEIMIGPKPRERVDAVRRPSSELVAALGDRLRDEFPTTRFNFTQPIIDSVTEDTNGTSANLAVEFSGPDSGRAARPRPADGRPAAATCRGAVDVNIEQEGPQPQLVIQPDRALCARYNVRIEDVDQLINTALGGEPVGTLYEGERRFDIVAKFDRDVHALAAGDRPAAGLHRRRRRRSRSRRSPRSRWSDGQTIIARENGRRRITVRCDIVGRDQGGFVAEAQRRFDERRSRCRDGYRVSWLGMFENLARARRHFAIVIPITIALIYVLLLVVTFGSQRAALLLLLSVPFAFIGGVLALYVRGMNLNVSTGVGFAALFGVSIMNGVLMVRCDHDPAHAGRGAGRGDRAGRSELPAADPDGLARRHPRSAAGVAGDRPGLRRAAAARHGHRLGPVQLDGPDAVRRAGALPHLRARPCPRRRPPRRMPTPSSSSRCPTSPSTEVVGLRGVPAPPRRRGGGLPHRRRDQPGVRPASSPSSRRRDARLRRHAAASWP